MDIFWRAQSWLSQREGDSWLLELAMALWSPLKVWWLACVPVGPTFAPRGAAPEQDCILIRLLMAGMTQG